MKKVLLTGVNGFIGTNIAKLLLEKGYEVIGLDIDNSENKELANSPKYSFFKTDITNPSSFPSDIETCDTLIHCAALVHNKSKDLSRDNFIKINFDGTRNSLEFLKKLGGKHVVFISTISVYGEVSPNTSPDESTKLNPADFYGESKVMAEDFVKSFSVENDLSYSIFRLTPVYGRDFLLNLNKRIYLPKALAFYKINSGSQLVSLCSVKNVAEASLLSIENPIFNKGVINLKDNENYSFTQIIEIFKDVFSQKKKPVISIPSIIPESIFKIMGIFIPNKAKFLLFNLGKITNNMTFDSSFLSCHNITLPWNLKRTLEK